MNFRQCANVTVLALTIAAMQAVAGVSHIQEDGMDIMVLSNRFGSVSVALHGAQIRSYHPAGLAEDLLFCPKGRTDGFGGIPVCWPWFGRNGAPGSKPHGFARDSLFEVRQTVEADDVSTLVLGLKPTDETRKAWPYDFDLEYSIRLSETLELALRTRNTDTRPVTITEGLHPYWLVSDRRQVRVDGLDGSPYCFADVSQVSDKTWKGTFVPDGHFDHVFTISSREQTIHDEGWKRRVSLCGQGYSKIVIWMPDDKQAKQFALDSDEMLRFVCVEPATLFRLDAYTLPPSSEHVLKVKILSTRY